MRKSLIVLAAFTIAVGSGLLPASADEPTTGFGITEGGIHDYSASHITRFHAISNGWGSDSTCYDFTGDCSLDTVQSLGDSLWIHVPMPYCTDPTQDYCIESVMIYPSGTTPTEATFIKDAFPIENSVPANPDIGIPHGGQPVIVSAPGAPDAIGGDTYMVQSAIHYSYEKSDGAYGKVRISEMKLSVFPVSENGDGFYSVHDFTQGTRVGLTVRAPKEVGGWFKGRLGDAQVQIKPFDNNDYLLSIDAQSVRVPQASIQMTQAQLDAQKVNYPLIYGGIQFNSSGGVGFEGDGMYTMLDSMRSVANDTSSSVQTDWYAASAGGNIGNCASMDQGLAGLVATNATVYSGSAPSYDSTTGIGYKIASMHLLPDGLTTAMGNYDLVIRDDLARCVFGFKPEDTLSTSITVSEGGTTSQATTAVTDENGYLHVSVKDFHFSTPTIYVKLTTGNGSVKPPVVTPSKTPLLSIVGKTKVGSKLRVSVLQAPAGTKISYQWLRDGKKIAKATAKTYKAVAGDTRHSLSVRVKLVMGEVIKLLTMKAGKVG